MSETTKNPINQHHTPRFYLEYFTDKNAGGHLWSYDKQALSVRNADPKEVAKQRHYYTIMGNDGILDYSLEKALSDIEGKARVIYNDVIESVSNIGHEHKLAFSSFLATQYVRGPSMRRMISELYGRLIQHMNHTIGRSDDAFHSSIKKYITETNTELTEEEIEDIRGVMLDPSDFTLQVPQQLTLSAFACVDELTEIILQMKWTLLEARHGYFITGDNPLVQAVPMSRLGSVYDNTGFTNRYSEITFPLSSQRALLITWGTVSDSILKLGRQQVNDLNKARIRSSERHVFSHICDKRILRMIKENKDFQTKCEIVGFKGKYMRVEVGRFRSHKP